jgi:hypothetical protein
MSLQNKENSYGNPHNFEPSNNPNFKYNSSESACMSNEDDHIPIRDVKNNDSKDDRLECNMSQLPTGDALKRDLQQEFTDFSDESGDFERESQKFGDFQCYDSNDSSNTKIKELEVVEDSQANQEEADKAHGNECQFVLFHGGLHFTFSNKKHHIIITLRPCY